MLDVLANMIHTEEKKAMAALNALEPIAKSLFLDSGYKEFNMEQLVRKLQFEENTS